jgi:hypothetical protein
LGILLRYGFAVLVRPPNEMRISCGRSGSRPHKPSFLIAFEDGAANSEFRARPARRLHARVKQLRGIRV